MKNLREYIELVELAESQIPEKDRSEYDDEAGMVMGNLKTIMRSCDELLNTLKSDENLPEWVQEKLAMAKQNIAGITDYMRSQHEQGLVYRQGE